MRGRAAPARTADQQKEHERRQALTCLDVVAMRVWMDAYAVGALGDDRTVLISMHETRAVDLQLPKKLRDDSIAWLRGEHPESIVLAQLERAPQAFSGPCSSRRRA